jgi:hypothetical protein
LITNRIIGKRARLLFYEKSSLFFCYAKIRRATTGIVKIIALTTHHRAS